MEIEHGTLEAGITLGLALLGSVAAYVKGSTRADEKIRAIREYLQEMKDVRDKQNDENLKTVEALRKGLATLHNDHAELRLNLAQNYVHREIIDDTLERISGQINTHQLAVQSQINSNQTLAQSQFNRLEDKMMEELRKK